MSLTRTLSLSVALLGATTAPALARPAITFTRTQVTQVHASYDVQGTSQQCGTGYLDCAPESLSCSDHVFVAAQEGREVTYAWDRDAKQVKLVKSVSTFVSSPTVSVEPCAVYDSAMHNNVDGIPDAAFQVQNLSSATLKHSPVYLSGIGFNLFTLGVDFRWSGKGQETEKFHDCQSYLDPETNTCATFRQHSRTRLQSISGNIAGLWESDFFVDPNCPAGTGTCTPSTPAQPIDLSPARATNVDALISEARLDTIIENARNGACSCPLVTF